jgi:hypothetical protein
MQRLVGVVWQRRPEGSLVLRCSSCNHYIAPTLSTAEFIKSIMWQPRNFTLIHFQHWREKWCDTMYGGTCGQWIHNSFSCIRVQALYKGNPDVTTVSELTAQGNNIDVVLFKRCSHVYVIFLTHGAHIYSICWYHLNFLYHDSTHGAHSFHTILTQAVKQLRHETW